MIWQDDDFRNTFVKHMEERRLKVISKGNLKTMHKVRIVRNHVEMILVFRLNLHCSASPTAGSQVPQLIMHEPGASKH